MPVLFWRSILDVLRFGSPAKAQTNIASCARPFPVSYTHL